MVSRPSVIQKPAVTTTPVIMRAAAIAPPQELAVDIPGLDILEHYT